MPVADLVRQHTVPRWAQAALVLLLLVGLFVSRPTPQQFYRQIWLPALAGMKMNLQERREQSALYKMLSLYLSANLPGSTSLLEAGKDAEMNRLPAFWMEHTAVHDWKLVTYFRYDEAQCFSDYLGVAGTLVNLHDGCDVEPYRAKGAAL